MLLELRKAKKSLACDQVIQTRKPLGNCLIFFLISLRVLRTTVPNLAPNCIKENTWYYIRDRLSFIASDGILNFVLHVKCTEYHEYVKFLAGITAICN